MDDLSRLLLKFLQVGVLSEWMPLLKKCQESHALLLKGIISTY